MIEKEFKPSFENYESSGITDFFDAYARLEGLMKDQIAFESGIVDINGKTLKDMNTVAYILTRGIQGEAQEALEETDLEAKKIEMIDILIFLCSGFNKLGMTGIEVETIAREKMGKNFIKYSPENFEGKTIEQGLSHSREIWRNGK